jgi:subtilisin family serine protease
MHRRTARRVGLAVTSAALLAASIFPATAGATTTHHSQPPSTPVPVVTPDGMLMSYVVNAKKADPGQTRLAERAVKDAGGVVVQSWPQIGVVIAHSTRAAFRKDVVRLAKGHAVESVGASRTAAVSEGTPETVQPAPGPAFKSSREAQKSQQQPQVNGFAAGDVSEAAAAKDPREGEQWNLGIVKADKAHDITDGSRKVVVGVLDSGIQSTHPDLAPNIDAADSVSCIDAGRPDTTPGSWEPTTSGHGTHVAGIIAAARNGVGIVGVAPGVRLASVKVVNDDGFIYPEYAICGFIWAAEHHMDVTNNSYFIDPWEFWCDDQPDQAAGMEAVRRAVAFSEKKGVVSAAAAGNSAYDLANKTTDANSPDDATTVNRVINNDCRDLPTELPGVATVSSIDINSNLSSFSNIGLGVIDVAAPGSRVLSTFPNNTYALLSGTSMASPHAAGVLALMKSTHPKAKPAELMDMLRAEADDHACPAGNARCTGKVRDNSFYGEGIADALDAVSKQEGHGGHGPG